MTAYETVIQDQMDKGQSTATVSEHMNTAQALAWFDTLEPVDIEFMIGQWRGEDFPTGHPLEGLLARYGWYGKTFLDADHVHPLVFTGWKGKRLSINPLWVPIGVTAKTPRWMHRFGSWMFPVVRFLMSTRRSAARLRMSLYRNKVSVAMVYDQQPVQDVFRKIDANTVLGVMDCKGIREPYFFVLRRQAVPSQPDRSSPGCADGR